MKTPEELAEEYVQDQINHAEGYSQQELKIIRLWCLDSFKAGYNAGVASSHEQIKELHDNYESICREMLESIRRVGSQRYIQRIEAKLSAVLSTGGRKL